MKTKKLKLTKHERNPPPSHNYPPSTNWFFDKEIEEELDEWLDGTIMYPKVDVTETKNHISVHTHVPDLDPKRFNIEAHDGYLAMSGVLKPHHQPYENAFTSFQRALFLPDNVDPTGLQVRLHKDDLTITLPKLHPTHTTH